MNVDYRTQPCPKCSQRGGLVFDPISSTLRCRHCSGNNLRLERPVHPGWSPPTKGGIKNYEDQQEYPSIPTDTIRDDVVEDYCVLYEDDIPVARILTGRIYCPKNKVIDDSVFNPDTPQAQFIAHVYAKRFANRRRYDKDIKRRRKNEAGTND